jgi:hypothetical protein
MLLKMSNGATSTKQNHLNRISVCQADPSRVSGKWFESFYQSLSIAERARAHRFVKQKDRVSHVITYGLLRLILGYHCQLQPKEIQIHRSALGKPYVTDDKHFNLSHTKLLLPEIKWALMLRDYCRIVAGCFPLFLGGIFGLSHTCLRPNGLLKAAYQVL